ncbi:uncharacterized protein [Fopius arisanus]|nr:PREDICTED: uncharacterized protein LOC105266999 isoform X2 [Fopius arisanus]
MENEELVEDHSIPLTSNNIKGIKKRLDNTNTKTECNESSEGHSCVNSALIRETNASAITITWRRQRLSRGRGHCPKKSWRRSGNNSSIRELVHTEVTKRGTNYETPFSHMQLIKRRIQTPSFGYIVGGLLEH